ncbi:MAG: hypothetical protein PHQ40_09115 [Anaerolineaceae bacterium]|nr:hypothetical protein [Anaerolineaceae bacterium]
MPGLVDLEHGKEVLDATRQKLENGEWDGMATLRATAHLVKDAYIEGRVGRWQFAADEPPSRGGSDQAPSPLEHFMAGVVF